MLEPLIVRDATDADIAQIAAIYAREVETGVATFEESPPSKQDMLGRMTKIQQLGLPYLIAERAGKVLGYAYAGQFHARAAYRYTLEDTVYIHEEARRQGVARALLTELMVRAQAIGCRQMIALITHVPHSASEALHAELGFRPVGVLKAVGFKFGRWLDLVFMQCILPPTKKSGTTARNGPAGP